MVSFREKIKLRFVCFSVLCIIAIALIGGIAEGQKEDKSDHESEHNNAGFQEEFKKLYKSTMILKFENPKNRKLSSNLINRISSAEPEEEIPVIIMFKRADKTKYAKITTQNAVISSVKSFNGEVKYKYRLIDAISAKIPAEKIAELAKSPLIDKIWYDEVYHLPPITETNESINLDVSTKAIGADYAWNTLGYTGAGITVAVLDSGIDYTHPDLGGCFGTGCRVKSGYDFYNEDSNPMDDDGHGTHVAGIIGANGVIKGVAPGVDFLAVKVCGEEGCPTSLIIAGIDWAVANGADIISMSLGGQHHPNDEFSWLHTIIADAAVDRGVVVVISAGNEGPGTGTVGSPASAKKVITVGASDGRETADISDDYVADFSSRGPSAFGRLDPEVVVPGVAINSTVPSGNCKNCDPSGYKSLQGTSMAAPHVSGAVALLLQSNPSLTPEEVRSRLMQTASPLALLKGTVLETIPSPSPWPEGLAWEGTYLWLADNYEDVLYQIDVNSLISLQLFEQGTGIINITRALTYDIGAKINGGDRWEESVMPGFTTVTNLTLINKNSITPVTFTFEFEPMRDSEGDNFLSTSNFELSEYVSVPPDSSRTVKITFSAPFDANPAIYGTTLLVKGNNSEVLRVPIVITIPLFGEGVIRGTLDDELKIINNELAEWGDMIYYKVKSHNCTSLTATLSWSGSDDLDLYLLAPNGEFVNLSASTSIPEVVNLQEMVYDEYWLAVHAFDLVGDASYNLSVSYGSELVTNPESWQGDVLKGEIKEITFKIENNEIPKSDLHLSVKRMTEGGSDFVTGTVSPGGDWQVVWKASTSGIDISDARYMNVTLTWSNPSKDLDMYLMYLNNSNWETTRFHSWHWNNLLGEGFEKIENADIKHYIKVYDDFGVGIYNWASSSASYNLAIDFKDMADWSSASLDTVAINLEAYEAKEVNVKINTSDLPVGVYDSIFVIQKDEKEYVRVPIRLNVIVEKPELTTIDIIPDKALLSVGDIIQFIAKGYDQYGSKMEGVTFNWSSSNETVGIINESGVFEAIKAGKTVIYATSGKVTGSANVTVRKMWVYVPDDYSEIQKAIDAADTKTVIVRDGIYTENIKINKSVTVKSENGSASCVIQAENPYEDVINITADYVNISGFTIKGAVENTKAGINVLRANNCNISNNNVSNNFFGIHVRYSGNNILRNNSMGNNTYNFGVFGLDKVNYLQNVDTSNTVDGKPVYYLVNVSDLVFNPTNAGYVAVVNGYNLTVKDLILSGNRDGVILVNTRNSLVENITATDSWHGIFLTYSEENTITGNNVSNNRWGIALLNSTSNVIADNRLENNTGFDLESGYPPSSGIILSGSGNTLSDNNVSKNFVGISFLSKILSMNITTMGNVLINNNMSNNIHGIYISNSSSNRIYLNNFVNTDNVYSSNSTNIWNSTYTTYQFNNSSFKGFLGNYWSYYDGTDADGDGIGDSPYNISSDKDYHPLIEPFESYKLPRTYNITGNIYYEGDKNGEIRVMAFAEMPAVNVSPLSTLTIPSLGEFVFELPNGTYYLKAYMDINSNNERDINEPAGYAVNRSFDEEPGAIDINGSDVSGIDITLFEDESPPVTSLNISSIYTTLNFNGTGYEPNSTMISFEIEDNTLIENATLEITNDNVTSYYYEIDNRSYSNFTEFYLEEPDTFTARLSSFDVWGNYNFTEVLFYGLGRNLTIIENITEVNLTVAENVSIGLKGENGTANLSFEETTTCDIFNITEMVAYRFLNLSGKITNVSVLELKIECGGVEPIIFLWDKNRSEWTNISAMGCIDSQDNLLIVNISRLAEMRGKNLSDFLSDPILALSIAPDLVVGNINAPSNMISGNNYEIKVKIENTGNQNAAFNLTLEVNGDEIGRSQISLGAGNNYGEVFKWKPSAGTYELTAKVDPENAVTELNESNNERRISVKVNQPPQEEQPRRRGGGGGGGGIILALTSTPTPTEKPTVTPTTPVIPRTISTPEPAQIETPAQPTPTPAKIPEPGTPATVYILLIALILGSLTAALYFGRRK